MEIREIESQETLELRHKILRPNNTKSACVFPGDNDSSTKHFGAFSDDRHVGIVSIYRRDCPEKNLIDGFQIRAMATVEEFRGRGVGLMLLGVAENYAFGIGGKYVWANARISAIGFYKKAGYDVGEKEFLIEGVGEHVLICKPKAAMLGLTI